MFLMVIVTLRWAASAMSSFMLEMSQLSADWPLPPE